MSRTPHSVPEQARAREQELAWAAREILEMLLASGAVTRIGLYGLRPAAAEAFARYGYRLATITKERPPHDSFYHLSLYLKNGHARGSAEETRSIVDRVLREIAHRVGRDDYTIVVSGRRLVVSVWLRRSIRD